MTPGDNVFRPSDGALLDPESLAAIADAPDRLLGAWLELLWPGGSGLVTSGLELEGEPSSGGPPGSVRPEKNSEYAVISPGTAIVTTLTGRRCLIEIDEPLHAAWPTSAGPAVQAVLVLSTRVEPAVLSNGPGGRVEAARERVSPVVGFVKPDLAGLPHLLPLAASTGNLKDWATDLRRVWQPDHPHVRTLLKRFETLDRTVWRAEPVGPVWEKQTFGKNWVKYQNSSAAALQAARTTLLSGPLNTLERVRLLDGLYQQLASSVEKAATELLDIIGPAEGAGPYRAVGAATLRSTP